jgi:DNA adenine methylase
MTQEQLAILSGIDRGQISRIESGTVDIQVSTVEKIANALELDASSLFITSKYSTHPFVKWAGGKTQLLDRLTALMPTDFNDYYEPFIGGGALLFRVNPMRPHINDMNDELLSAYRCFLSDETYQELIKKLDEYDARHSEENYMAVRSLDRDPDWVRDATDVDRAARMIYLNKACFNGLYRVNSKGYFNVPSGKKKTVNAYDEGNFENIRAYFKDAEPIITHADFSDAVSTAKAGDFIYFDPPYDTWDEKESFTSYDKEGFGKKDQARLAECYRALDKRGAKLMLSNHNTRYINELYAGFDIHVVNAKRMINSDASGRGDVEEVIITNYR